MRFAKVKNDEIVELLKTEHDKPNGVFWLTKRTKAWRESHGYFEIIEADYNRHIETVSVQLVEGIPTEVVTSKGLDLATEKEKKILQKRNEIRLRISDFVREDVEKKIFDPTHIIPQEIEDGREAMKQEFDGYELWANGCTTLTELFDE